MLKMEMLFLGQLKNRNSVLQVSKNRNSVLQPVKNSSSVLQQSVAHQRAAVVQDSIVLVFLSVLLYFLKNPPKLSLNRNSSPNRLGHLLMLGVNSSLRVIGVSFQLYGQLKKSPHDSTGVLGSSAISMASQTTRLGKGSSITA